jgi:hypothetical protein
MQRPVWSWLAGTIALAVLVAGALIACGPEASRSRDGGLGGSSRGDAPPTRTSEPALVVQPTMNIPYATPGALPTLRLAATPGTPIGNPVATANPTPQVGSPTVAPGTPSPSR